jgi:CHAT domain-containing protein
LLLKQADHRTPLLPWRTRLLAFGDPVTYAEAGLPDDRRWSRLPDSDREIRSIAHAMPGRAEIHSGADNQKRYLTANLKQVSLLHFSTHAAADPADANRSRMLFSPQPGRKGSEYLFRSEVQNLPLAGVDLVTLSACDTEAGTLSRGEGVQSFSRAFLAAGALSTVTTLWRVADGPTADFMQIFYERLAAGDSKADALRAAKLRFLRSGTAAALPKYWAAFVLNGDGQRSVPAVFSWLWIAGAFCAAAVAIVIYRRSRAAADRQGS